MNGASIDVEDAFAVLKAGHDLEREKEYWGAAQKFHDGEQFLRKLAATSADATDEEQQKVSTLYQQQATQYNIEARRAFVEALKSDLGLEQAVNVAKDRTKNAEEPELTAGHRRARIALFAALFTGQCAEEVMTKRDSEKPVDVSHPELSLEERLTQLTANLPSQLKSPQQRMNDIQQGLGRLGICTYSHIDNAATSRDAKSEDEQMDDILAQARDEAALLNKEITSKNAAVADGAMDDPMDDVIVAFDRNDNYSTASADNNDELAANVEAVMDKTVAMRAPRLRSIQDQAVEAQAALAQLVAMLEVDEDEDAEIQLDPEHGWNLLQSAQQRLRKAEALWRKGVS